MKQLKLLSTILLAGIFTVTTFGQTLSTDPVVIAKQQAIIEKASQVSTGDIPKADNAPYSYHITVTDKFGNLLPLNTKWLGETASLDKSFSDKASVKPLQIIGTRTGYKDVNVKYTIKDKAHVEESIVLQPTKTINTVMGKVEATDFIDMYLELVDTKKQDETQNYCATYLKVQKDGTFKCVNIPNGTYTLNVVKGVVGRYGTCYAEQTLSSQTITINGNYNGTIKVDTTVNDGKTALAPSAFFNTIDYEQAKTFVKTNELLKFTDEAKADILFKVQEGSSDVETVKNIMRYIDNNYWKDNAPIDTDNTRAHSVLETYKNGYANDCLEFCQYFEAICCLYNIPTVQVHGMSETFAKEHANGNTSKYGGHMLSEVYLKDQDKWVLVDPTSCLLTLDYNPNCPVIRADGSEPDNDYLYIIRKTMNSTAYYSDEQGNLRWAQWSTLLTFTDNFDLSLFDHDGCNYSTEAQYVK